MFSKTMGVGKVRTLVSDHIYPTLKYKIGL